MRIAPGLSRRLTVIRGQKKIIDYTEVTNKSGENVNFVRPDWRREANLKRSSKPEAAFLCGARFRIPLFPVARRPNHAGLAQKPSAFQMLPGNLRKEIPY